VPWNPYSDFPSLKNDLLMPTPIVAGSKRDSADIPSHSSFLPDSFLLTPKGKV
tara:strand:+ start:810 stop:968 length:159 start_codon:yes stop_codon:yes gene_type:complete